MAPICLKYFFKFQNIFYKMSGNLQSHLELYTNRQKVVNGNYHKSSHFDVINGEVAYLVERRRPYTTDSHQFVPSYPPASQYPSLYPKKNNVELPSWIIYDKQVLSFGAYYEDPFDDRRGGGKRRVRIYFFLEDGTIQVNEQKVKNCGLSQGTLVGRRRIPFPRPADKAFYEMIDLNVGKCVEFYGRTYFIVDCDKFTRQSLNRSGIAVPEPVNQKEDQTQLKTNAEEANKHTREPDKLGQFLKFDGHVLRFFGYWDDRKSENGDVHKLIIQYYLSDDTLDVRVDGGGILVKRCKLSKGSVTPPHPGTSDRSNLLNILTTGYLKGRMVKDAQNVGALVTDYYTDSDLLPGVTINVYGRAVTLTDCDPFTRDFYKAKYGIEHFTRLPLPTDGETAAKAESRVLPPWNGFGTFEDSEGNCLNLVPKPKRMPSAKLSHSGIDSYVLRFVARMESDSRLDQERSFIFAFYLADNTASVFEMAPRNSGFERRMFIKRKEAFKPTESLLVARKPSTYTKDDLWIGNAINIDHYTFKLIDADEYTLRYMEVNSQEFPKSNVQLIMDKIRGKLRPNYKQFVQKHLLGDGGQTISKHALTAALTQLMASDVTPHEIITITRKFAHRDVRKPFNKETLRNICRNECRRLLFNGFDRLEENLHQKDFYKSGYLPLKEAYCLFRGARVPVDTSILQAVLQEAEKNHNGEVSIKDLLSFIDPNQNPCAAHLPFSLADISNYCKSKAAAKSKMADVNSSEEVDCVKLIEYLGLEDELKKEV